MTIHLPKTIVAAVPGVLIACPTEAILPDKVVKTGVNVFPISRLN
jgi:hypothetical protein